MTRRNYDTDTPQKPVTSLRPARTLVVARHLADGRAFVHRHRQNLINPLIVTHPEQLGGIRFHRHAIWCTPTATANPRYTEIRAAIAAKFTLHPAHGEGAA